MTNMLFQKDELNKWGRTTYDWPPLDSLKDKRKCIRLWFHAYAKKFNENPTGTHEQQIIKARKELLFEWKKYQQGITQ